METLNVLTTKDNDKLFDVLSKLMDGEREFNGENSNSQFN